jgi:hypothetical protein
MRDLTFLTLLLMPLATIGSVATRASGDVWLTLAAMLVAEFLLGMRAAESLAVDLVRNVLAEESART